MTARVHAFLGSVLAATISGWAVLWVTDAFVLAAATAVVVGWWTSPAPEPADEEA